MARARITRSSGTVIVIEGSADEVAEIVERIGESPATSEPRVEGQARRMLQKKKATLPDLLVSLIERGFFKEPKDLSAVKRRLAEMGHVYPATTLSPALLRRVRGRQLRRLQQGNRWTYTG